MEPEINNCSEVKRQQSEILYNEIVFNLKKNDRYKSTIFLNASLVAKTTGP